MQIIRITIVAAIAAVAIMSRSAAAKSLIAQPNSECRVCTNDIPQCKELCAADQECVVAERSCDKCATATCQDVKVSIPKKPEPECRVCTHDVPQCKKLCAADQECVVTKRSCDKCATATCKKIEMSIPEKPKKSPKSSDVCVKCFAPVECPVCAEDEYCQKEPASCNSCGTASCIKLHRLPKSAFIYKRLIPANDEICVKCLLEPKCPKCKSNEQCELIPQDCKLCSKAKCVAVSR